MKHNISLTMLNWNGELLSMTLPKEPKSGKLRVSQYSKYLDHKARFQIASKIVKQKVALTKNLLLELSRYYEEVDRSEIESRALVKTISGTITYNRYFLSFLTL